MIRWSRLKAMQVSPLHYRHGLTHEREDTDAFKLGRLIHTLALQPHLAESQYVAWMDGTRRGKAWDAFCVEHSDKTIVTAQQMADAHSMAEAVRARWVPASGALLEHEAHWADAATGLLCGGRVDALSDGVVVELKSARSITAEAFSRDIYRYGYHCQLAHYRTGLAALGLCAPDAPCAIVAVESSAPYDTAWFTVAPEALAYGEEEVARLIRRVAECEASGEWPGQYPRPVEITLPRWAMATDENEIGDLGLHDSEAE